MLYLGIDPGQKGGLSFVSSDGSYCALPMPDIREFCDVIEGWSREFGIKHCFIEKAQPMHKQGVVSTFTYADHYGQLQGALAANCISFTLVRPQEWQKEMFKGSKDKKGDVKRDPKERALEVVRRMFPKEKFLASLRCKKPHDGMIDSILLAEFCRRKIL